MESNDKFNKLKALVLFGSVLIAAALLVGSIVLANTLRMLDFSSGAVAPNQFDIQSSMIDSEYMSEDSAMQYVGLYYDIWQKLLAGGELDGTFITFDAPPKISYQDSDGRVEYEATGSFERVYSKEKLNAWMEAKFTNQGSEDRR